MDVLDLPPTTASVPVARRFVRARLVEDAASAADGRADVDIATLLVSEVVTNAILHARSAVTLTVDVAEDVVRAPIERGGQARRLGCLRPEMSDRRSAMCSSAMILTTSRGRRFPTEDRSALAS